MTFKLQLKCDLFWKLEYVASCFRCFLSGAMKNVISVYAAPPHGRWCFNDRFDWSFLFNPLQASLTADEETRTPWSPWTATHLTGLSVLTPPRPTELLHVALIYRDTDRCRWCQHLSWQHQTRRWTYGTFTCVVIRGVGVYQHCDSTSLQASTESRKSTKGHLLPFRVDSAWALWCFSLREPPV